MQKTDEKIIKPNYYNNSQIDLIESWYLRYSWDQFIAIMQSHIDRYTFRHDGKNGMQDLDKADEYLQRLKQYRIRHEEYLNSKVEEAIKRNQPIDSLTSSKEF